MRWWIPCGSVLLCGLASGQQPAAVPAFEVASIKPAQPMPMGRMMVRMNADAGMLRYTNVSLKDCVRVAYRVKDFQIQGPDWLGSERFDIQAKLPDGASKDQIPEMLQALLAERFKLALHRDTKEHAVYALVAGKDGPKLKPAEVPAGDQGDPGGGPAKGPAGKFGGPLPRGAMMMQMSDRGAGVHVKASSATIAGVAEMLSHFTERPVVDMTGIQGQYDFDFAFTPETMRGMLRPMGPMPPPPGGGERPPAAEAPAEPAVSIFEAVKTYGLKLEPRKAPLEMLVIDHIEKQPTEN